MVEQIIRFCCYWMDTTEGQNNRECWIRLVSQALATKYCHALIKSFWSTLCTHFDANFVKILTNLLLKKSSSFSYNFFIYCSQNIFEITNAIISHCHMTECLCLTSLIQDQLFHLSQTIWMTVETNIEFKIMFTMLEIYFLFYRGN